MMPPPHGHIPKDGGGGAVTIAAAAYRAFGAVMETLPSGSGCVSGGLDDEEVQAHRPAGQVHPMLEKGSQLVVCNLR